MSTNITLDDLQTLFQQLTVAITGLPGTSVRIGYQPQGQPAWTITEDQIDLWADEIDNGINKFVEETYDKDGNLNYFSTRVMQISWSIYGPNSAENANVLRHGIYLNAIHDRIAETNGYLAAAPRAPKRNPYLWEGNWWWKWDFQASYNYANLFPVPTPYFVGANLIINTDIGITKTIPIRENNNFNFSLPQNSQYLGV